ncbi:MAG: nicotinate-nucleotide adenylyltransferase [Alphaproteobacteria bacterium]|nr:MAG: nicotinate-nucleotide adenylyltransferase [Alphaproteobacteria bacterium]
MRTTRPTAAHGARIGLLGGSFNPAHAAHLQISQIALRRLNLDQVWWLVSPQNPLKPEAGMAPFQERFESALKVAHHPRIHVSDWEMRHHSRFTAETLATLTQQSPKMNFVWLMGTDNLATIHTWSRWRQIFQIMPVAIFARPGSLRTGLASPAAQIFANARIAPEDARFLADLAPPAWVLLQERHNPLSATAIREGRR